MKHQHQRQHQHQTSPPQVARAHSSSVTFLYPSPTPTHPMISYHNKNTSSLSTAWGASRQTPTPILGTTHPISTASPKYSKPSLRRRPRIATAVVWDPTGSSLSIFREAVRDRDRRRIKYLLIVSVTPSKRESIRPPPPPLLHLRLLPGLHPHLKISLNPIHSPIFLRLRLSPTTMITITPPAPPQVSTYVTLPSTSMTPTVTSF